MDLPHSKTVVVGIDGSQAAVNAAKWAVDGAISRRIRLRLIHVVGRSEAQSHMAEHNGLGAGMWSLGALVKALR